MNIISYPWQLTSVQKSARTAVSFLHNLEHWRSEINNNYSYLIEISIILERTIY